MRTDFSLKDIELQYRNVITTELKMLKLIKTANKMAKNFSKDMKSWTKYNE